jgi:hypothetical protein
MSRPQRSRTRVRPLRLSPAEANRGLCPSNKRAYQSLESALGALQNMKGAGRDISASRAYPCPLCNHYHTSSK